MKKYLVIMLVLLLVVVGCGKKEEKKEEVKPDPISKIETTKEGKKETVNIILNDKEHKMEISEGNKNVVAVVLDDQEILSYKRSFFSKDDPMDEYVYKLVKGIDNKYYFALAIQNYDSNTYRYFQYLYIFNDEGKIIFNEDDSKFGCAFMNSDFDSYYDPYGDTGKYKIEEDKIYSLKYLNTSMEEGFSRCYENVLTINNDQVSTEQGELIKVYVAGGE